MREYTTGKGIWNGWAWRLVGLTVLVISALEFIAVITVKTQIISSLMLGVMVVSYWVIPRIEERKLANAIVGVVATVIIGFILQMALHEQNAMIGKPPRPVGMMGILQTDGLTLVVGIIMAYLYLRLTNWSQRKRAELDTKRSQKAASSSTSAPQRRHHSAKNKKRKKR
ncbi:hypothetical protein [Alicyclobacillus sp. SO9]|uniref:hypothetical protein n=1 Tax=Alicyclobacillus sp. SO9 TaxID=2665646 RepID=UPI0018E70FDC|nr:hypothetical protein [Alicyclobacillus sp. SO9]QQE77017.1 hypothetical protein GI364_13595 [Alicyclobacillus sp. SO9]